ncbi:target of Myb1 membrane trafficking protein-like isoform X2 [Brachionichthys hirsutus]|uniref:target of Myb1 membrane trafficking protein-like isoform X2 n=1 Tax=Brachionichthys hirsutus TaxID=412623 RepID=UPI0036046FF2
MFSLGEKMEFLLGNPFSTPVGQRIERATSGALPAEDWGLNMEICDIINETEEGPRDSVKALKKRIAGNTNVREVMFSLTVLETCVKNCGHRFQVLVASQEFVEGVLVRSILPKYNAPPALHDRVLSLIQSWADAFRSAPSLVGVVNVYDDLKRRGLEFPMTDLDSLSPIHTPNRSVPENGAADAPPTPQSPPSVPSQQDSPAAQPSGRADSLSAAQVCKPVKDEASARCVSGCSQFNPKCIFQEEKLRKELALVRGNLTVMSDMLNELTPGQSQQDDVALLQQLYSVGKNMQTRVMELIPQLLDDGLIEELLMVNDDLNNAFIRYERFDRQNKAQTMNAQPSPSVTASSPQPSTRSQPAVITATSQQQSHNHSGEKEEEFDMFAQTRGSSLAEQRRGVRYEDPRAVDGLAGALDTRLQVTAGMPPAENSVQNEIDKWLSCDAEAQSSVTEGVSSEDFDHFLDHRAKAADPGSVVNRSASPSTPGPPPRPNQQQDASHEQIFSL